MEKKIAFTDDNREAIIAEQEALGFRLYEEQRHFDGWWLLFTDEPYVEKELEIPVFDPPSGTGTPKRLEYLEQFLEKLYPKE